jgi:hypothetical protein
MSSGVTVDDVYPLWRRSSGCGLKHSWAHVQPNYTCAAQAKALEEAMAFGETLTNPWYLKVRPCNCTKIAMDINTCHACWRQHRPQRRA